MKRVIAIVMIELMMIGCLSVPCFATSNKGIIKQYCKKHYPNMTIKYFTRWDEKIMTNRKGKNIVYVEVSKSISTGKIDKRNGMCWGKMCDNPYYHTWYNKKVKKGKKVKQYCIFNPYTNYDDDVVAVIDNKKIRN